MPATVYLQTGEDFVCDQIQNGGGTATFSIGWGTGGSGTGGTATKPDLDLRAAATELRVTATTEDQPSSDINRWIGRLTTTTVKGIEEVGLFFHPTSTATAMIIRANHGAVNLATDDIIEYTITLEQT